MKKIRLILTGTSVFMTFAMMSCNKTSEKTGAPPDQPAASTASMISENGANPDEAIMTVSTDGKVSLTATNSVNTGRNRRGHFLYSESNEAGVNRILVFQINNDGTLSAQESVNSGGAGAGAGLGSEGALALSGDHEWLFAVNAGSNSVSSFKVHGDGSLTLAHTESSAGKKPVSISVHGNLLYVLNFDSDNIHGFRIGAEGSLTAIDGSTRPLSGTGVVPPQISFAPNGNWLIVTEKATNKISSFRVKNDGSVFPDVATASTGETPFGFDFGKMIS